MRIGWLLRSTWTVNGVVPAWWPLIEIFERKEFVATVDATRSIDEVQDSIRERFSLPVLCRNYRLARRQIQRTALATTFARRAARIVTN